MSFSDDLCDLVIEKLLLDIIHNECLDFCFSLRTGEINLENEIMIPIEKLADSNNTTGIKYLIHHLSSK